MLRYLVASALNVIDYLINLRRKLYDFKWEASKLRAASEKYLLGVVGQKMLLGFSIMSLYNYCGPAKK